MKWLIALLPALVLTPVFGDELAAHLHGSIRVGAECLGMGSGASIEASLPNHDLKKLSD
jgi:hypothetical protein